MMAATNLTGVLPKSSNAPVRGAADCCPVSRRACSIPVVGGAATADLGHVDQGVWGPVSGGWPPSPCRAALPERPSGHCRVNETSLFSPERSVARRTDPQARSSPSYLHGGASESRAHRTRWHECAAGAGCWSWTATGSERFLPPSRRSLLRAEGGRTSALNGSFRTGRLRTHVGDSVIELMAHPTGAERP